MNDVTGTSVASPGTQPGDPKGDSLPAPAAQDRCIRCQADLRGDRQSARFCPRCGARRVDLTGTETPFVVLDPPEFSNDLIAFEPDIATPAPAKRRPIPVMPVASQAAAWLQLSMSRPAGARPAGSAFGPQTGTRGRPNDDDVHSLMLLGYANAMYRLGWRYESGLGSGHNPQEALRCYFKAAKLGNIAALSRLAPQCVASAPPPVNTPPNAPAGPPPLGTPS